MPEVNWNGGLKTREGKFGRLMESAPWQVATGDQRRRVWVFSHGHREGDMSKDLGTTWLCSEDGRTRGDGQESRHDILSA